MGGDFNEVLSNEEKVGGVSREDSIMLDFRLALHDYELVNFEFSGPTITWVNKRGGGANVQERLDRFVCNLSWRNLFPLEMVEHLEFF